MTGNPEHALLIALGDDDTHVDESDQATNTRRDAHARDPRRRNSHESRTERVACWFIERDAITGRMGRDVLSGSQKTQARCFDVRSLKVE